MMVRRRRGNTDDLTWSPGKSRVTSCENGGFLMKNKTRTNENFEGKSTQGETHSQTTAPQEAGHRPMRNRLRGTWQRQNPTPPPPPRSWSRETMALSVAAGEDTVARQVQHCFP